MLERLGLIGNCQASAHVDASGAVVWCCLPRFDSEPVFGALLDADTGGRFTIASASGRTGVQHYLDNTNVLETRFEDEGGAFRVIDFFPRFHMHGRSFHPTKLIRIVEPLEGTPYITARCEPVVGWSRRVPRRETGSHHISYDGFDDELRLTTDAPLSYLDGRPFALVERRHFVLAWGAPVEEPLAPLCDRFLRETVDYWVRWVKHCNVPSAHQELVIRSALALKLHCFEDTGAIAAALTTSIPEAPGSGRTWDYRYCWLRDAYYALEAFRLLGHYEERERFSDFLLNIAGSTANLSLRPLYRIDGRSDLTEHTVDWPGYLGEKPVRIGNQAAEHLQHDVFGEMVLALAPMFLDARFRDRRSDAALDLVTRLARKGIEVAGKPDAGIWELRTDWSPQTFSSVMCWAGADRMATIAERLRPELVPEFASAAMRIRNQILDSALDPVRGGLVAVYGGIETDAALLQAVTLRLLPPDDPRMHATVNAVIKDLDHEGWLRRYRVDDGFGVPSVAFVICTFWLVEALAMLGRMDEARVLLRHATVLSSPLGLLAEDFDPETRRMWGNFPQAYSHVGLIHAAFAASPRWNEVL